MASSYYASAASSEARLRISVRRVSVVSTDSEARALADNDPMAEPQTTPRSGEHWMNVRNYQVVSPSYLSTLGIPIVDGRDFEPGDRRSTTGVVIVDDSAARRLWPDLPSPVGRMVKLGDAAPFRP